MAWTGWPVVHGTTEIRKWSILRQLWDATRERGWVLGSEFWPTTTLIQDGEAASSYCKYAPGYTGIINSAVATGGNYVFTDSSKAWTPNPDRWYDFVDALQPDAPRFYDLIIEFGELDPWKVIRTEIIASTSNTLTTHTLDIDDWCVATGLATDGEDLSGYRYVIARHNQSTHRSLHWHDRWLDWPNAVEYAHGENTVTSSTTIADAQGDWPESVAGAGGFVGKHLMLADNGGRRRRIAITGNTKNTITFASPSWTPGTGEYAVVDAGAIWAPGRSSGRPWRWYGGTDGPMTGIEVDPRFYSHWPDHTIQPTPVAALQITVMRRNDEDTACVETQIDAFSKDVWSEPDDECDAPNRPYSPDYYKTLRSIQDWNEGNCSGFIEAKSYSSLAAIPNFVPATWFKAAGINHFTTTVSTATTSGTPYITFPAQSFPDGAIGGAVHYAILDADGEPVAYGFTYAPTTVRGTYGGLMGTLISTTRIDLRGATPDEADAGPPPYPPADVSGWVGLTLVISLGWDRHFARRFRYLYDKTVFVAPDGSAVSTSHPGFYLTRPASTQYAEYSVLGTIVDTDTPTFVDGEAARYVGDNWDDPTLPSDSVDDGQDADTPYRDRLFTGVQPPEFGTATGGDATTLQDLTKDWWNGGTSHTESGTATAGSSTGLTDSSKSSSAIWDAGTGRYVGFVVEVNELADGTGPWHKRLIATMPAAGQLTWTLALPFSANGKAYRIREPFELDRWRERILRIYLPGATVELAVLHSDDNTLYFASIATELAAAGLSEIPAGTSYHLIEAQPGEVLQWDATPGQWVYPTGTDARGSVPWRYDPTQNAPTVARKFGQGYKGDYITRELLNQLRDGINALVWTKTEGFWRNYEGPDPPPDQWYNRRFTNGYFGTDISDAEDHADDQFTTGTYPDPGVEHTDENDSTLLPMARKWIQGGSFFAQIHTADSWAILPNVKTVRIAHEADAYAYTSADPYDVTAGDLPRPTNVGSPSPYIYTDDPSSGGHLYFDAQGSGAQYRAYGLLATKGASFDSSDAIKVGDFTALPPHWPSPTTPTVDQPNPNDYAGWSVAHRNGVGSSDPTIVHRWDVTGGMTFVA